MTLGKVALDLSMACVGLSVLIIVCYFLAGTVVSVLTVARAGLMARRRATRLRPLSRGCPITELAAIDEALDRVAAREHGLEHTRPAA